MERKHLPVYGGTLCLFDPRPGGEVLVRQCVNTDVHSGGRAHFAASRFLMSRIQHRLLEMVVVTSLQVSTPRRRLPNLGANCWVHDRARSQLGIEPQAFLKIRVPRILVYNGLERNCLSPCVLGSDGTGVSQSSEHRSWRSFGKSGRRPRQRFKVEAIRHR